MHTLGAMPRLPAQELSKFLISKTKTAAMLKQWRPCQLENSGRGERIRTSGLYVPNQVLQLQESGLANLRSMKINNLRFCFPPFPSVSARFK
ncbi:hypothetical protein THICB3560038 [Thiomonas sp. CB3]|nr:hypothetical protein THICB3560038 [Thiomonas sp. CB3]